MPRSWGNSNSLMWSPGNFSFLLNINRSSIVLTECKHIKSSHVAHWEIFMTFVYLIMVSTCSEWWHLQLFRVYNIRFKQKKMGHPYKNVTNIYIVNITSINFLMVHFIIFMESCYGSLTKKKIRRLVPSVLRLGSKENPQKIIMEPFPSDYSDDNNLASD